MFSDVISNRSLQDRWINLPAQYQRRMILIVVLTVGATVGNWIANSGDSLYLALGLTVAGILLWLPVYLVATYEIVKEKTPLASYGFSLGIGTWLSLSLIVLLSLLRLSSADYSLTDSLPVFSLKLAVAAG